MDLTGRQTTLPEYAFVFRFPSDSLSFVHRFPETNDAINTLSFVMQAKPQRERRRRCLALLCRDSIKERRSMRLPATL